MILTKVNFKIRVNYQYKMKYFAQLSLCFLWLSFSTFPAQAQQFFLTSPPVSSHQNVPFFYQHQLNAFSKTALSSKQHLVYGVLNNIEAGLNFLNFYPVGKDGNDAEGPSPESNILSFTLQSTLPLSEYLNLNIGVQQGISHVGTGGPVYITGKHYALLTYHQSIAHYRLTGGPWVADKKFNGAGDRSGIMLGGEWMFSDGIYLMGDWVSGRTKNSVSVLGGMVDLGPGIQLCAGYLIPNPKSSEGFGLVLELNLFTL